MSSASNLIGDQRPTATVTLVTSQENEDGADVALRTREAWRRYLSGEEPFPDPAVYSDVTENIHGVGQLKGNKLRATMAAVKELFVRPQDFVVRGTAAQQKERLENFYRNAANLLQEQSQLRAMQSRGEGPPGRASRGSAASAAGTARKRRRRTRAVRTPKGAKQNLEASLAAIAESLRSKHSTDVLVAKSTALSQYVSAAAAAGFHVSDRIKRKLDKHINALLSDSDDDSDGSI